MHLSLTRTALAALIMVPLWAADSPTVDLHAFVGTWKENSAKSHLPVPQVILTFTQQPDGSVDRIIGSGKPMTIHFDGKDYPAPGAGDRTAAWTKVDANTYEVAAKRDGKITGGTRYVISDSGKKLTANGTSGNQAGSASAVMTVVYERTSGNGETLLGSWKPVSMTMSPETFIILAGDSGELRWLTQDRREIYSAKMDGKEYPQKRDAQPRNETVALQPLGERSFREAVFANHQPWLESTYSLSSDGKTLTVKSKNLRTPAAEPGVRVFEKQ